MVSNREKLTTPLKNSLLKSDAHPDWCPGCGDFGITNAIQSAVAELGCKPWETYFFTGVGCSGKTSHYVQVYGAHTLHGRVLAFAAGAKISNPRMTVIAGGGDGDGYGIGAGHFMHAGRRNLDMTYVVFNNEVYGLTKGQASPTLPQGAQPKSLSLPNPVQGINPLALAIASGYTFVARSYAFDARHLKATIKAAIDHPGMALVDVLQPCPTYNDLHTKDFYAETVTLNGQEMPRVKYLEDEGYNGEVSNPDDAAEVESKRAAALARAYQAEAQVALGTFWQIRKPTFSEILAGNVSTFQQTTPAETPIMDAQGRPTTDAACALNGFVV
ncbi:MAG: thiamine pyrophosphate-dependent enzyme [Candidatus Melainabacteria bacterium]